MCELTCWSKDLTVDVAGHGVINHAGTAALRLIAGNTGLTAGLSKALTLRLPKISSMLVKPLIEGCRRRRK
jgi:hypothetical protein